MSACEALVFFQDRHPRCDFPGFELFLLFTLCCHGDGEITDVKSWNPGPPATFSLCLVWSGLLFTLSAEPRVCYTEVSNEDSGLRNKVKLHSTSRHMFSTRWVILLESKVGLMKTQRLTAVRRFFSLVGNRMMPQNKAPIHRSFPAPEEERLFQMVSAMICKEAKRLGRTWVPPSSLVNVCRIPVHEAWGCAEWNRATC